MYQSSLQLDSVLCRRLKGEGESIEYLDLSSGFISSQDLQSLVKYLHAYQISHHGSHSLIEIDLSSNQLCGVNSRGEGNYDPEGFNQFTEILQSSRVLKSLTLDRNFLSIPGCQCLGKLFLNQNSLENISLKSCKITNEGAAELAKGLVGNRSLSVLDLSGNVITSIGLSAIFKALNDNRRSELKYLDLSGNGIECEGCECFVSFLKDNNSLKALLLDDNPLGVISRERDMTGIQLLANILPNLKKLAHLSLQNNQISDQGISVLSKALETNRTLTYLGLQWNLITDTGGKYLAKGLSRNSTLLCITLVGNKILPSTARLMMESSTLTRGNVIPPCELDIPFGAESFQVRPQNIFQSELDLIEYFDQLE